MNVSLTPELERLVTEKVDSGMYASASEVVREALRLLSERDEVRRVRLEELKAKVRLGLDQADAGETIEGSADVFDEIGRRGRELLALRSRK